MYFPNCSETEGAVTALAICDTSQRPSCVLAGNQQTCNRDLLYFTKGWKLFSNCLNRVKVSGACQVCFWCQTYTLLPHCYLIGSDTKVCLFQLPLILYIICCYLLNFFLHFFFFFFWWNVPTCSLFQQSSLDSCVCCKERTLANRHAAFVRGTRHFHLFSFFPSLLMKGTINLAILPLLKHTSVDVLCFFWT